MGKIVAIVGQIASGKTTLMKYMSENGFERIIPYTTRPKRDGEKHGADYWFISPDEFAYYSERGYFAEETSYKADFGYVRYGIFKESLETPDGVNKVIVLNPQGVTQLKTTGTIFLLSISICRRKSSCVGRYGAETPLRKSGGVSRTTRDCSVRLKTRDLSISA